jgi:hypothetical protein
VDGGLEFDLDVGLDGGCESTVGPDVVGGTDDGGLEDVLDGGCICCWSLLLPDCLRGGMIMKSAPTAESKSMFELGGVT